MLIFGFNQSYHGTEKRAKQIIYQYIEIEISDSNSKNIKCLGKQLDENFTQTYRLIQFGIRTRVATLLLEIINSA